MSALSTWADGLDQTDPQFEHHLLEALWVTWGANRVNEYLVDVLLDSEDHRIRAATVRYLRYMGYKIDDRLELLQRAASDPHGRVRLEAIVAASWLDSDEGMSVLETASNFPLDDWMLPAYEAALAVFGVESRVIESEEEKIIDLEGEALALYRSGEEIYNRDGFCATCHQSDGKGLPASGFPPLAGTSWVNGPEDRLVKIILKGLQGPINVLGKDYPGQVPMTPYEGMLNDAEIAAVATYVRNSFGNSSSYIPEKKVAEIRKEISGKKGFYSPEELLNESQ
jgi:mono/diheme cytochrome c family protein